jgi:REP element-mobilizing transposase RayT
MTTKFRNKYRIKSTRLNGYDYTRNGAYFITICTKRHICLFGNIDVETGLRPVSTTNNSNKTGKKTIRINLSEDGKIVTDCWFDLPNHYSNIILDEFIVMPNHVHGIILIQNYTGEKQKHGLSEFVRAFKSFSSRRINEFHKSNNSETWQSRFYDHIIHSENELNRIRIYINNNPDNWLNDQHYICSNSH